jgi:aminopeptidase
LYAEENPMALAGYPTEKQNAISQGHRALRSIMIARVADGKMRRCSAFFPTQGLAQRAHMSLLQYEDFFYRGCKLHLDDPVAAWQALADRQQHWVDYLNGKELLQVRGPDVDLELSVKGRRFINSAGHANFPCGEIFTTPLENSVNGCIKFTYPAYYGGNEVLGAELIFKDGQVVEAKAAKNEAFLLSVLDTDPGARRMGEFAIGTNYDIKRFTGSIVFDEKIGGTIHTAVGQAYPQTGGVNDSKIHWDLICDMRESGEIYADGELFYRNGHFLTEIL